MKKFGLVLLTLLAGLVGLGLRLWRFGFELGSTELLEGGTLPAVLLTVWSVAVAAGILLLTGKEEPRVFSVGIAGRLGQAVLCAYLIFSGVWTILSGADILGIITAVLALVAAAATLGVIAGWKGNHIPMCLFTVVFLISRFRVWSLDPQIAHFSYPLLAGVTLMLAVYHRAAFDMGMGSMKAYRRWCLLCAYFALVSAMDPEPGFYAVVAAWLLSNQLLGVHTEQNVQ